MYVWLLEIMDIDFRAWKKNVNFTGYRRESGENDVSTMETRWWPAAKKLRFFECSNSREYIASWTIGTEKRVSRRI